MVSKDVQTNVDVFTCNCGEEVTRSADLGYCIYAGNVIAGHLCDITREKIMYFGSNSGYDNYLEGRGMNDFDEIFSGIFIKIICAHLLFQHKYRSDQSIENYKLAQYNTNLEAANEPGIKNSILWYRY